MKIGVITNLDQQNYGSILQAYALQMKLAEFGADPFIIQNKKHLRKDIFSRAFRFFTPSKYKTSLFAKWQISKSKEKFKIKQRKLKEFCDTRLNIFYTSNLDEVSKQASSCDLIIAGSDQIWSPAAGLLSPYTLLSFGSKKSFQKASYAASLGVEILDEKSRNLFRKNLADFSFVSVREKTGATLISDCYSNPIRVDIDPTLLFNINYWEKFVTPEKIDDVPYIFVYMLQPEPITLSIAKLLSKHLNMKIKLCSNRIIKDKKIENIADAGVEDFLSLIYYSDYFVTNSFHGSAFAVNFHKNFLSVSFSVSGSRVRDFLGDLDLIDHNVSSEKEIYKIFEDIRWEKVEDILNEKRKASLEYLQRLANGGSK